MIDEGALALLSHPVYAELLEERPELGLIVLDTETSQSEGEAISLIEIGQGD